MSTAFIITSGVILILTGAMALGFWRGTASSAVRLVSTVLCAVLAVLLAFPLSGALADSDLSFLGIRYEGETVTSLAALCEKMLQDNTAFCALAQDEQASAAIGHLPAYLTSAIAYAVGFVLAMLVTLLIHMTFHAVRRFRRGEPKRITLPSRMGGLAIGLVTGCVCLFSLVPFAAMQTEVEATKADLPQFDVQTASEICSHPILQSAPVQALCPLGERYLDAVARYHTDDATGSVRKDFADITAAYRILADFDMYAPAPDDCTELIHALMDADSLRMTLPVFLRSCYAEVLEVLRTPADASQAYSYMLERLVAACRDADVDFWLLSQHRSELPQEMQTKYDTEAQKRDSLNARLSEVVIADCDAFSQTDLDLLTKLHDRILTRIAESDSDSVTTTTYARYLYEEAFSLSHKTDSDSDASKLRALFSAESFRSARVTVQDITVRYDIFRSIDPDDRLSEADSIARVLHCLQRICAQGEQITQEDLQSLCTGLRSSITLRNTAKPLLYALAQSDLLPGYTSALKEAAEHFDSADFRTVFGATQQ